MIGFGDSFGIFFATLASESLFALFPTIRFFCYGFNVNVGLTIMEIDIERRII